MRRALAVVATAVFVVALGAPAFADNHRSPSDHRISAMRDHDGDHRGGDRGGDRHDGFRHGDDRGRHGDDHDGYYRHNYGYDRYGYGYPYYYDGYYGDYYQRCRWAYYNDRYYFDRYCRYYNNYGYYRSYMVDPQPAAPASQPISAPEAMPAPDQTTPAPDQMAPAPDMTPAPDQATPAPAEMAPAPPMADSPGQGLSHYDALHHDWRLDAVLNRVDRRQPRRDRPSAGPFSLPQV